MNGHLLSLGPADIARLFHTLNIKGIIPGVYEISKDLKNSLKAEISKKKKNIHSKTQKGQTEVNKH